MIKAVKKWEDSLTPEEKKAIKLFTGDWYTPIRKHLCKEEELPADKLYLIDSIDSALSKFKVPNDILTYRTEGRLIDKALFITSLKKLNSIEYKSYISTSLSKTVAINHIETIKYDYPNSKSFVLINGNILKNSNCGYLGNNLSSISGESEVLIIRNKKFIYDKNKIQDIQGKEYIEIFGQYEI